MEESKILDIEMDELAKVIDELDRDILKIKIPESPPSPSPPPSPPSPPSPPLPPSNAIPSSKPTIPRIKIIEQQLKYQKERLVYYETKAYRDSVSKEKALEDVKDATIKFRFFITQKEIELEKES